ncbi:cation-translocating P-type ATPase [Acidimangrovimonas pyrenivorans]|uniref:Cation-translocating P-type ATPase n=1 Tax=Acidimangrovimonas pyrenivorans TaxID=2030798 RepID=A0ABV7AEA3_9RHOB
MIEAVQQAHALTGEAVLAQLSVTPAEGLSEAEAGRRLAASGPNRIAQKEKTRVWTVLFHQVRSPVVVLLSAAAVLAALFGEIREAVAVGVVLALNTVIGFTTEIRAVRSIEALRALGTAEARVRRDGNVRRLPVEALVPGDIVLLAAGDKVPSDLRLIRAANAGADESSLTGEAATVTKSLDPVAGTTPLGDRTPMLFRGTSLVRGSALGVVTATGLATEFGQITRLIEEAEPAASPLEKRLTRLSGQLIWATLAICALVAGAGVLRGEDPFLMVEAAIALAVAAIPEGLPIVATLALARGMLRMARSNALVERLSAVETLGATTVILTDKTGTLTENRMTVRRVWLDSGEIEVDGGEGGELRDGPDPALDALLDVATLCNEATLGRDGHADSGDPTELALLRLARQGGRDKRELLSARPLLREYPFDEHRKMMATLHRDGESVLYAVKGAPEAVLPLCSSISGAAGPEEMTAERRQRWLAHVAALGQHGLRVLALASKRDTGPGADPYRGLELAGIVGLEDPARVDVPDAIHACRAAGIRVIMVTGDHADTAQNIARAVGLDMDGLRVAPGAEIGGLAGRDELEQVAVFARVSPAEKLALVRAWQERGAVVAMTGDGINDAPALRQADIGIAMGLRGTDVAREAAAMILLDDAFPTIVKAIREGRVIFGNIRRFSAYLLACNLSEVLVVGGAMLAGLPLPLLPLQILYLNLVTDVFPAFALALGEGEEDVLARPPRKPGAPVLARRHWAALAGQGLAITVAVLGAELLARDALGLDWPAAVTVGFLTLAFAQLWHVLNMRRPTAGLLVNEITRNPWIWGALALCAVLLALPVEVPVLRAALGLVVPTPAMWGVVIGCSLLPLVLVQSVILALGWRQRRAG